MTDYVVPLYQNPGEDFEAPWLGTSGSGYIQFSGWVPFASLSDRVTLHGSRPAFDIIDETANYVEVSNHLDSDGNSIWPATFYQSVEFGDPSDITGARLEIEARSSSATAGLFWGISGSEFFYTNAETGAESGDDIVDTDWHTYVIPLIDEGDPLRTIDAMIADLLSGSVMAAMSISAPFDVSALRLVIERGAVVSWVRNVQRNDGLGVSPWRWGSNVKVNARVVGITFSGFGSNQSIRWRGTR